MSLILDHVSHVYGDDTALAVKALDDVSLEIPDGQFIGLTDRPYRFRKIDAGAASERFNQGNLRSYLF